MAIRDDEELERLAGLQLRESLVKGLRISEHLQASLRSNHIARSISATDALTRPDLFSCKYHEQCSELEGESHFLYSLKQTPNEHEQRVLGMTRTIPHHGLSGSFSTIKLSSEAYKPQQNWPVSKPIIQRRYYARNSIQSKTHCKAPPSTR